MDSLSDLSSCLLRPRSIWFDDGQFREFSTSQVSLMSSECLMIRLCKRVRVVRLTVDPQQLHASCSAWQLLAIVLSPHNHRTWAMRRKEVWAPGTRYQSLSFSYDSTRDNVSDTGDMSDVPASFSLLLAIAASCHARPFLLPSSHSLHNDTGFCLQ